MVVWGGLINSSEKKRSKRQRRKRKIYPFECRVSGIARTDKKAFLSNQCKVIEENNQMEKTRYQFKKIRDTKGNFHAKISTIKGRNGMGLIEAEDIKKRWKNKTDNLEEMDKFLEKYNFPKLNQEEIEDLAVLLEFISLHITQESLTFQLHLINSTFMSTM